MDYSLRQFLINVPLTITIKGHFAKKASFTIGMSYCNPVSINLGSSSRNYFYSNFTLVEFLDMLGFADYLDEFPRIYYIYNCMFYQVWISCFGES